MRRNEESYSEYQIRYEGKREVKRVSFNKEKAEDIERLRKLQQIPDFSNWVKSKIDELPSQ